jgi:hypothetical protein
VEYWPIWRKLVAQAGSMGEMMGRRYFLCLFAGKLYVDGSGCFQGQNGTHKRDVCCKMSGYWLSEFGSRGVVDDDGFALRYGYH